MDEGAATLIGTMVVRSDTFAQTRVVWSPQGTYLYSTSSESDRCLICVFRVATLCLEERLVRHKGAVRDLAIHGDRLMSVSFDKSAIIWRPAADDDKTK